MREEARSDAVNDRVIASIQSWWVERRAWDEERERRREVDSADSASTSESHDWKAEASSFAIVAERRRHPFLSSTISLRIAEESFRLVLADEEAGREGKSEFVDSRLFLSSQRRTSRQHSLRRELRVRFAVTSDARKQRGHVREGEQAHWAILIAKNVLEPEFCRVRGESVSKR